MDQADTYGRRKLLRVNQAYLIFLGAMVKGVTSLVGRPPADLLNQIENSA